MLVQGTFEITAQFEPPHDTVDGVALARARFDKRFQGPLEATSAVEMLSARTRVAGSAGYVAIERVRGVLAGRRGTFVLQHMGVMRRGAPSLTVSVVPDSGTGELRGLRGSMDIQIADGVHHYTLDYEVDELDEVADDASASA